MVVDGAVCVEVRIFSGQEIGALLSQEVAWCPCFQERGPFAAQQTALEHTGRGGGATGEGSRGTAIIT